ncbi:c6 zinc finger protein [Moniliophthora roreri MCA 2997]|uniref:C6 zinc finger protein n=1 Tax=Moniliophthora roreri (strain MCA 2997) TaxID=1381753 RepID=V2Y1X5_MONRO|nr:c6 zinc finger protein [Moniliophthora roreri MCA 2997]
MRFHTKSKNGCLTCRKRHIKCDEGVPICKNCHRRELVCVQRPTNKGEQQQQQQESVLYKTPTAPTPSSFTIDTTSLEIFHHFITTTCHSYRSNPAFLAESITLTQTLFSNPVCMHATLAFTAIHLARLYEPSSSSSSQTWIIRASAHRKAATKLIPSQPLKPGAHFITVGCLSLYAISSSLSSSSSSLDSIFSLITSLHNVCSPLKQFVYADPYLKNLTSRRPESLAAASKTAFLAPLHHLYDTSMDLNLDLEELDDPDIREAYRTAVLGLCVAYLLSQTGQEGRSALFWPTLIEKRFLELLNERRQRALVILYYYLMMLRNLSGRCWWVSEVGRWVDYMYGLIDERWREWLKEVTAERAWGVVTGSAY